MGYRVQEVCCWAVSGLCSSLGHCLCSGSGSRRFRKQKLVRISMCCHSHRGNSVACCTVIKKRCAVWLRGMCFLSRFAEQARVLGLLCGCTSWFGVREASCCEQVEVGAAVRCRCCI